VLQIKALYKELDLEGLYKQTEEQSYVEVPERPLQECPSLSRCSPIDLLHRSRE